MRNDDGGFTLSPTAFAVAIATAISLGGGVTGTVLPRIDEAALKACYDNSRIAIDQANSQGLAIDSLHLQMADSTRDRWTGQDHLTHKREHQQMHDRNARTDNAHEELQDAQLREILVHIRGHHHEDGDGPVKHEHKE